jgi:hypothetical protein
MPNMPLGEVENSASITQAPTGCNGIALWLQTLWSMPAVTNLEITTQEYTHPGYQISTAHAVFLSQCQQSLFNLQVILDELVLYEVIWIK